MTKTLAAAFLATALAFPVHGQTGSCTASIDSIAVGDDHIDVSSHVTLAGCSQYGPNAWQMVVVTFNDQKGNHCTGTTCTSFDTFGTQCLADGSYTVTARPYCTNDYPCNAPEQADHKDFTITRVVQLSGASAQQNPPNSVYWDIQAGYNMPNTYGTGRAVHVYDNNTNEYLGGCPALDTPSGTCTATAINGGCGREVRVQAEACNVPKPDSKIIRLAPVPNTPPCALRGCVTCPKPQAGQPINVGGGDATLSIPLFSIDEPAAPLSLDLYYNSQKPLYASISGEMGLGWSHSFAQSIVAIDAQATYLYYVNPQGMEQIFQGGGSIWTAMAPTNSRDVVTTVGSEYHLTTIDGTVTAFDIATGHWNSTTDRWGNSTTATYDNAGNLTAVTDAFGRIITVVASGTALQQVVLPGGATWTFGYTNGNLSSINDPLHATTPWRTFEYTYNRVSEPRLLTAMKDDSGIILESHTYDSSDRALTSGTGGGLDQVTVAYGNPRHVTHQLDPVSTQASDFTVAVSDSHWVATSMTGGCASCGMPPGETRQYDGRGRVTQKTDALGTASTYAYDPNNNLRNFTEAYGTSLARTTLYEYNDTTWPTLRTKDTVAGPYGNRITTRSYDPGTMTLTETTSGELSSTGPLATYTTTMTFDSRHRLLSVDGPRADVSDVITRTYYPDNDVDVNRRGRLHTTTNAVGLTTTYDNYDILGAARLITDPNGTQTTIETDARGRTTAVVSQSVVGDPNESITYRRTTTYDSRDRITQTVSAAGNVTGYAYEDGTNRLIDTIRYDAAGNQIERRHLTLNFVGWKTTEELQSCASPAPACSSWVTKRTESYTYTNLGQLQDIVHADNTKRSFVYDALLRVSTVQDENHATPNTTYTYDFLNRLKTVRQTLATALGGIITTTYAYNAQDQLTSVIDPNNNTTTYAYDDFGRLTSQASPVTGTTTYGYDAAGNLTSTTDANGATTTRTYDGSNRAITATSTRSGTPTENITWTYDAASGYGKGRLTSTTDPAGATVYEYDRRGLLRRETKTIEGNPYVSAYSYDADGNRTNVTTPSGRTVTYTFDSAGRPASAGTGATTLASNATYLPFGPLAGLTYGNGTTLARTYDDQYRLLTNKLAQGLTTIAEYDYQYDAAGNITQINDATDVTYNRAFGYDDINRLVTANTGTSLWGTGSYTYDSMGNMLSVQVGGRTASFAYTGTTPKLATVADAGTNTAVSYDAAGNESASTYTYTARNSLATNDGYSYTYDARGVRTISTTVGTGVTVTGVTLNPSSAPGGDSVSGIVTLSGPAPSGGATVALTTDDQRVIQVPSTVFVAPGATSASFTATTFRPIAASLTGSVRAFHQGSTATTAMTVLRVPRVNGVALNPSSVTGGNNTTATVSIDIPTTVDTVLALTSSNGTVAPVPASVTVPAGSTSTTVNIATASIVDDTSITISATFRGTATGVLAVTAIPVTVSAVSVAPVNVVGGRVNATGTVTLNRVTGVNGAVINLASSNTNLATVPATLTIASGAASGSFSIATYTSSAATPVAISATYGTTQSATLTVASCSDWTVGAATLGSEIVWFDDAVPAGSRSVTGTWTWDTAKMASGTQSHVTLTTGTDEHKFDNYPNYFHFNIGDQLVQYVLVDPCNPPAEIMLQFGQCCDGWFHRSFWGQDLLQYDQLGNGRIYMGPIPTGGQWMKLTAPASQMSMSGSRRGDVYGVAFDVAGGGHVWFDRTGEQSCTVSVAAPPASLPPTDVVWFDDAPPAGASLTGTWTWDTTQKASGSKSHNDPTDMNFHQHYFQTASQTITPGVGDSLVAYVLMDPCDPPNEILLQWYDGTWNHRAYWGPNAQNCGSEGPACHSMGALPAFGTWLRLVVPASAVGLESHTLTGMAFGTYNGHAWFDRPGIQPAGSGKLVRPPASVPLIAERPSLIHRLLARWRREPDAIGFGVSTRFIAHPTMSGPTRQYSFYTPELQLLSETALTDAPTPAIANDYILFGGEPLAQIATTGEIAYNFNDHIGAPILQTTGAGSVVWRAERDPYGNRNTIRAGGDRHQPLGLPGQETSEATSALQYNIHRWYRSAWGKYTQADPVGLHETRVLSELIGQRPRTFAAVLNLYAYASDNPIGVVDPDGLSPCNCFGADPLPSTTPKCNDYENATYGPISLKCFCKCAGDSHWSQEVRGCLACSWTNGTNMMLAHEQCYAYSNQIYHPPTEILLGCLGRCYVGFNKQQYKDN